MLYFRRARGEGIKASCRPLPLEPQLSVTGVEMKVNDRDWSGNIGHIDHDWSGNIGLVTGVEMKVRHACDWSGNGHA